MRKRERGRGRQEGKREGGRRGREGGRKGGKKRRKEGEREGEGEGEKRFTNLCVTDLLIEGAVLLGEHRVTWVELLKTGSASSGLLCRDTSRKGTMPN